MANDKKAGMVFAMPEEVAQKIADGNPLTVDERGYFSFELQNQRKFPFSKDEIWWADMDEFEMCYPKNGEPMFLEMRDGTIKAAAYWEDKDRYWGFNATFGDEINIDEVVRVGRLIGLEKEYRQSIYRWE